MTARRRLPGVLIAVALGLAVGARPAASGRPSPEGTVEQLLAVASPPFAIGHRGSGENLGEDPTRPLENTVPSVREAFLAGLSVVEVDVQLTRDGEVVAFHDDVLLPDLTCINTLTLAALQERLPHVPSLQAVLNQVRRVNQAAGPLRGLVILELKPAAPLCDRDDTLDPAIVSAVASVVRRMAMTEQVMLASLSPALLSLAAVEAPEIPRVLTISALQLLSAEEAEQALGCPQDPRSVLCPVVPVDKALDLGLQWAEVGLLYRLPGYRSGVELFTAAALTGVLAIEAEVPMLRALGAPFVQAAQATGLRVFAFAVDSAEEWEQLQRLGVDAIYTDDARLGAQSQPPIP